MTKQSTFPAPIGGLYHDEMWAHIGSENFSLQCCENCGQFRYPPGPACPICLSFEYTWNPVSGKGKIISWVIFHKGYLDSYPAPYNVIAVRLVEGPTMISNLIGPKPSGSWIGHPIELVYEMVQDGGVLPRFRLSGDGEDAS